MLSLFKKRKNKKCLRDETKCEFPDPFISFLLAEDKNNNILLGKRDDTIFVSVKNNEKLSAFMHDWFYQLKLYRDGHLSEDSYNTFLKSAADRYLNEPTSAPEKTNN